MILNDIHSYLKIFVEYVLNNSNNDESEILEYLMSHEMSETLGNDVITFAPVAFSRMYLRETGVLFSDIYIIKNGEMDRQFRFSENKIYEESIKYYNQYMRHKFSKEELFGLFLLSSEFDGIIKALENNANLKNLVTGPMIIDF